MGRAVLRVLPTFKDTKLVGAIDIKDSLVSVIDKSDVVIDFSGADGSISNLKIAADAKKPFVLCSTGHNSDQLTEIKAISKKIGIVLSPNMSVGVNVMLKLIGDAVSSLGSGYKIDIVETHHVHKKDAPSGTAKKMMEIVERAGAEATVKSIREGEVVGEHVINFTSPYERLQISHSAFSREVFANGALRAALWIVGKKPGLYSMEDVLAIK